MMYFYKTNIKTEVRQTVKHNNATREKKDIKVLGIDLAKQSFQLHGVDEDGNIVLKKTTASECGWIYGSGS